MEMARFVAPLVLEKCRRVLPVDLRDYRRLLNLREMPLPESVARFVEICILEGRPPCCPILDLLEKYVGADSAAARQWQCGDVRWRDGRRAVPYFSYRRNKWALTAQRPPLCRGEHTYFVSQTSNS